MSAGLMILQESSFVLLVAATVVKLVVVTVHCSKAWVILGGECGDCGDCRDLCGRLAPTGRQT
jgi:hypothetical protein